MNDEFFVKLEIPEEDKQLLDQLCGSISTSGDRMPREVKPRLTLRICLRFHMKIFDPLGF